MLKSVLKKNVGFISSASAPNYKSILWYIETAVEINELITVRMRTQIDMILDRISKEVGKDLESPIPSDYELEVQLKALGIEQRGSSMECGNVGDIPLNQIEKELLLARIAATVKNCDTFSKNIKGSTILTGLFEILTVLSPSGK